MQNVDQRQSFDSHELDEVSMHKRERERESETETERAPCIISDKKKIAQSRRLPIIVTASFVRPQINCSNCIPVICATQKWLKDPHYKIRQCYYVIDAI